MRFGLLGPIEAWHNGRLLAGGSGRERFVLATMLLNAGRLTRTDTLIDALWDEPPSSAKAQLHNLISRLRRRLPVGDMIVSRPDGYEMCLAGHELDLFDFREFTTRGRQAAEAGDHALAAGVLADALALWRGPALADVADELVADVRQALHDERLVVIEAKLDAELALGRNDDVLRQLPSLAAEHPYREGLHEKRMLALARSGRRADALAAYRCVYRMFADELGVEPGSSLRELERRVLRGEISTQVVPRQLPSQLAMLAGREDLIREITGVLRTEPVVLLLGPGGVGKTALALAVAHGAGDEFPDGQLYADLRGNQDPHLVAGRFLRALGVDGANLPDDPDERITLYRSHLARRRILVVLDDATSEEQVRPLLPGTADCRTLVTSRRQLAALLGAARRTIPVLTTPDGLELLSGAIGRERVAAEQEAAAAIVEQCAGLPLAVSIAAARLAVNQHGRLAGFRQRLAEERGRLDVLSIGDLDVRAGIALSYHALDPQSGALLRRLGLVDAPDWPDWVAGGSDVLDRLTDLHLVEPLGRDAVGQERFRLHDLVADFARERAFAEDPPENRVAAVAAILSGWLALAAEADDRVPHHLALAPDIEFETLAPPPAMRIAQAAPDAWFEAERGSLTVAVDQACRWGLPDLAGALALRMSGFFWLRCYHDEWERALRRADSCVRDGRLRVLMLGALFEACLQRHRYAELPALANAALALARRLGDAEGEVRALRRCGQAAIRLGRFNEAVSWLEPAVEAARHPEITPEVLRDCLGSLAWVRAHTGESALAVALLEEALTGCDTSIRTGLHLYHYGLTLTDLGRLAEAGQAFAKALEIARAAKDDLGMAYLEQALADVDIRSARWPEAAGRLERARAVHGRLGGGDGLAETLRSMGDLAAATGRWTDAVRLLRRSLDIWRDIGELLEIARTLARLERALAAVGDTVSAAAIASEYRAILTELGLDDTCLRLLATY